MKLYIKHTLSESLQKILIHKWWKWYYRNATDSNKILKPSTEAFSKDQNKAYVLYLCIEEKAIDWYDYAFVHDANPVNYIRIFTEDALLCWLEDNLWIGRTDALEILSWVSKSKQDAKDKFANDDVMSPEKIAAFLSWKLGSYEKYPRLLFYELLERKFNINSTRIQFYREQANKHEEEFYRLMFDYLIARCQWSDNEIHKLVALLKEVWYMEINIDLAQGSDATVYSFNYLTPSKQMNNLEITLQELTYDKEKLFNMIHLVKSSKTKTEMMNKAIADLSTTVSEIQNAVFVLENYLNYTVDQVEEAINILDTDTKETKVKAKAK